MEGDYFITRKKRQWLSINPNSEPASSVELVANYYDLSPGSVTPNMMAFYYNNIIDPTVCSLSVSHRSITCSDQEVELD
jgi:hypothetical protein